MFMIIPVYQLYHFLTVNKGPLKDWEIKKMEENRKEHGNEWCLVVKDLEGRTPLQAKNHFNAEKKYVM